MATLGPGNEFDLARKRAQQQESANLQGQNDAIKRRAAQAGGGISGAFQKQEQVAADESAKRLQGANEGIQAAQTAEERRMRETAEGRQFATSEREASQGYASGESALQRRFLTGEREGSQGFQEGMLGKQHAFATSERLGSQGFAAGESRLGREFVDWQGNKGRDFATSEREASQGFATGERREGQAFADWQGNKGRDAALLELGERMKLAWAEFGQSKYVDEKNLDIANKMLAQKGPLESLFGGFGEANPLNPGSKAGGLSPFLNPLGAAMTKWGV